MPEGKRIPPPPIFPEDDQSTAIAQDRPFYSGKKRRIPPPPLFRDDEQPSLLGEDLYDIFTTTGRTLSEGLADLEIGPGPGGRPAFTKNPIAGGAKILRSVGEAVAAPFGLIDRLLRTNSITTPIAEGAAMPFELAAGAVRGGEKLIDVGLRGAGVPESVMNLGMDPQKAAEAATALSELNQIAAQFAVPLAGKKIGGKTAGKIIKMQEEASRPIFRPSNREPVDYIAPESRQLYPPRNQRFEQRPGQPVRDIKAGVPLRKVPPLLPENLPLRKPEFEPVRTFEVGPEGGAKAIKSTPAPLTSRIDKALSDVAPSTKVRIKRKIEAKEKLSVGEKNILTQRDRNLFDDVYEPKGLPQLPEGGIPAIDNNIVFDINDYRSGESFGTVRANDPNTGKTIGKVDFSEYGGNVYVKMVEVTPEFRRQGIATKMYDRIKQEYPKAKIERFGDMSTDEGAAFRESLKGEAEKAPKPDPTTIKTKLISLRDQVNKGRYRGRVADITEAELLARRNGFDFSYDPGTLKYNVISAEGKKLKKVPEVKMSDNAPNPTLLENINPETRTRIQDILDEVGEDINIESLTKPQIEAAIKDIRIDKGKEASRRAQMLIDELLKAEAEGIVGVVSGSVPGVGKDIRGINVNDLLEQKYEREGIVGEMGSGLDVPVPEVNIPEVQRRRANSFTDIRSLEEELRRVNLVVKSKESLSPSEQIELGEYYDALLDRRGGLKPVGEPLSFDKTAAGEQGSFAKLEQAKMPPRKPSGLSYEQQVEGTMFEKPKTPGAPQEEMFRVGNPDALAQQIVNIATTGEGASIEGIARARELAEQSKDIFTGAQREEIASFLNDLESKLKKPGAPVVLTAEDIVREQSGLSKVGARSGKSIEELYPSKPKPQSWQGAVSESSKRLKEKGLSPDRPQGNLPSGLDPTTLIDPKKVKYIIDPIIKKATSDARKMIIDQRMRPEQFPFEVRSTINTLLSEHPDFRGLSGEQKRAIFNHVKDVTKNLVFNPVVGEFNTRKEFAGKVDEAAPIAPTKAQNDAYINRIIKELKKEKRTPKSRNYQRPIISSVRERIGIYALEAAGRGLRSNDRIEYVRSKMIEEIQTNPNIKGAAPGRKLTAFERLESENVDRWMRFFEQEEKKRIVREETDRRNTEIANQTADRILKQHLPPEQVQRLLSTAQKFRVNSDNQWKVTAKFKSRVSTLAQSYGAAGGELANRMYQGDLIRSQLMEKGNNYINNIRETYEKIDNTFEKSATSDAIITALEDRTQAAQILDTPTKKKVYENAVRMLDFFKDQLKLKGYRTREDYFTHIKDVDLLEQVLDGHLKDQQLDIKDLNTFISDKSRFLKPRLDYEMDIRRDLPSVLNTYLRSVTKELAYRDGVDYYYTKFKRDIPVELSRNSKDRAVKFMENVLNPEKGRGTAFRGANWIRSQMYRNFLGMNLKASAQNLTQVDFARMRWTPEADRLLKKTWRDRSSFSGALADAVEIATTETPRYLEIAKSEEGIRPSTVGEMFNKIDTFQKSEGRNWGMTELGSIFNSVMKDRRYRETLSSLGGDRIKAVSKLLNDKDVFDKAIREAATTSAETQVAAAPSMRADFYDKPYARILGMFTAFKTRQLQVLGEALGRQEGINGTRAQLILRRGMTGEVTPVEVLREVEGNRVGMERMLTEAKKARHDLGVSYPDVQRIVDNLKTHERELNGIIRELEPAGGSGPRRAAVMAKYFAKVTAISMAFSLLWDTVDSSLLGDKKKGEDMVSRAADKALWDILPIPWYGANPGSFLRSPVLPNLENASRYGRFSGRGLTRDVLNYGLNVIPFAGVVNRATNRVLSKELLDELAPLSTKRRRGITW